MTGLFLGSLATDVHLHDTYFIVAHFHYTMMGGTVIAFLGGVGFLWIKSIECKHKWKDGLLWGKHYRPIEEIVPAQTRPVAVPAPAPGKPPEDRSATSSAPAGPAGLARREGASGEEAVQPPSNVQIFFGIYFAMTGLHALHVLGGLGFLGFVTVRAHQGRFGPISRAPLTHCATYWHYLDAVWIVLFAALYLLG